MRGQFSWTVGPDARGFRGGLLSVRPSRRAGSALWQAHVTDDGQQRLVIHGDPSLLGANALARDHRLWPIICAAAARERFIGIGWKPGPEDAEAAEMPRYVPLDPGLYPEAEPYELDWEMGEIRSPFRPPLALSPTQADIFYLLDKRIGRFISTERLIARLWSRGDEPGHPEVTLRTHMTALRHRLEPLGLRIESRRNHGYRLTFGVTRHPS